MSNGIVLPHHRKLLDKAFPKDERPSYVKPDLRALSVEIVDGIRGYTFEFSNSPIAHKDDYDFIEEKLRAAFDAMLAARDVSK